MRDLEQLLRAEARSVPDPSANEIDHARRHILAAPEARPRRHWRYPALGVALAALVVAAFAAGFVVAPSGASTVSKATGPGFLPGSGWNVFYTVDAKPEQMPAATAATVPLGADVFAAVFPWETARTMRPGDALIEVIFYPRGAGVVNDADFPTRQLPLSLGDADTTQRMEGQPWELHLDRLRAHVGAYNIDLFAFYPRDAVDPGRLKAEEEVDRLVIPD